MGLLSRIEIAAEPVLKPKTTLDSLPKTLEEKIAQFHRNRGNINCILFEIPVGKESGDIFCRKVTEMIDNAGTVIPLQNGQPLVLLPLSMDRELVAHRISKSLDTTPVFSIRAETPETIIDRVNSLP